MLPVVALVGRPNVGKSTLFNVFTKTKDALVADYAGLTRDRLYGRAKLGEQDFIVVDTSGLETEHDGIESGMVDQAQQAINECDVLVFIVDAQSGLLGEDAVIARELRKTKKPILLVINKSENMDTDIVSADFYQLGFEHLFTISASHQQGIQTLLAGIESELKTITLIDDEAFQGQHWVGTRLAIIGKPNVGKSTLTNRILGEERVLVYDEAGTTRDSVYIPMQRRGQDYTLIDTAGVRRRKNVHHLVEKFSVIKTLKAIENSHVVLLVIDAREGVADQDLNLLGFVINAGKALVIAVNKWDGLDQKVKSTIREELNQRLGFADFARCHFISALHGTGVGDLFKSVDEAYQSAIQKISTALVTKIVKQAQQDHEPPMVQGRRIKLKYAHAGGQNPPRIIIHGNQLNSLPKSYKTYLMNYFRKALNLIGTPIHIEYRTSDNPFTGQRKRPTLSQQRQIKKKQQEQRGKNRGK